MAIALIALAATAATQTAQAQEEEQENYAWITNTNGRTWKEILSPATSHLMFSEGARPLIAQIVVPEHAVISYIDVYGCANLTNLIYRPPAVKFYDGHSDLRETSWLTIRADNLTGLRTIATQPHIQRRTQIEMRGANNVFYKWLLNLEWTTNWQAGDPPEMEIRIITTDREWEVEVIWREGILQIANTVNGEWKDYYGINPYRFPLASAKDMQFFRIKPEEEEEPDEESQ